MTDRQRHGFILLLVVGLIAASVRRDRDEEDAPRARPQGRRRARLPGPADRRRRPTVTQDALSRAVDIMRERVDQLGVTEPEIQTSGGNQITVGLPDVKDIARAEKQVGTTARLEFYDWEANALTPNGKTVASQLLAQDPNAVAISEGSSSAGPGLPGGGSMSLYDAVKLASKQPAGEDREQRPPGPEYYMFGAPGSAACAPAAKAAGTTPTPGVHCLLSGPDDNVQDLISGLPAGVSASEGEQVVVPQGTVVLQAADANPAHPTRVREPDRPSSTCSRTTSRCSATRSPTRSRAPTRPAPPTSRSASPPRARSAFQNVTADDRPARRRSSASARRSTSTSRSRSTTS